MCISDVKVFERLQKLNICVSHYTTIKLVNEIGSGHDSRVCQWRDSLCKGLDILESVSDWKKYYIHCRNFCFVGR